MDDITWKYKSFDELTNRELYDLLALRSEIFVIEQACFYQDLDKKDFSSFHLLGTDTSDNLLAYARILPAGISYPEVAIGRVVVSKKHRKNGLGKILMNECFRYIQQQYGTFPIRISAQVYLEKFYQSFGFKNQTASYLEDGIPHVEMLLEKIIF